MAAGPVLELVESVDRPAASAYDPALVLVELVMWASVAAGPESAWEASVDQPAASACDPALVLVE